MMMCTLFSGIPHKAEQRDRGSVPGGLPRGGAEQSDEGGAAAGGGAQGPQRGEQDYRGGARGAGKGKVRVCQDKKVTIQSTKTSCHLGSKSTSPNPEKLRFVFSERSLRARRRSTGASTAATSSSCCWPRMSTGNQTIRSQYSGHMICISQSEASIT